eukprot:g5320.t1
MSEAEAPCPPTSPATEAPLDAAPTADDCASKEKKEDDGTNGKREEEPQAEAEADPDGPSQAVMVSVWAPRIVEEGALYRKKLWAFLRPAAKGEKIETVVGGKVESSCVAKGDSSWVVRAATSDGEQYITTQEQFEASYLPEGEELEEDEYADLRAAGFKRFHSKRVVHGLRVTEADMATHFPSACFKAPWGEWMRVEQDDMLVTDQAMKEVYRIEKGAFEQTYELAAGA